MSTLADALVQRSIDRGSRIVGGRIAETDPDVYVTVGSFDGHRQQWGPCALVPADAEPERGDDCLVLLDEEETPWVLINIPGGTFISGSGPPTADVGVDGGLYLDLTTLRVYGPKANGAWPAAPLARLMPIQPTYAQLKNG